MDGRILHIAPEHCFKEILNKNPKYVAIDKFERGYGKQNDVLWADARSLPFSDDFFDLVLCNHVLEHIVEDKLVLGQLFRVLKPGGIVLLTVPYDPKVITSEDFSITDPRERERRYGQWDHVRLYGNDLRDRIESIGFSVSEIPGAADASQEDKLLFGLDDEPIFLARKG